MSLVPFFTQERNCQRGRHEPTKTRLFLKLRFEAECIYSILTSAPNDSLPKPESFPVGLRSPLPRQLEAGHCSPTAQRQIVCTMIQNSIFAQSIYHLQHPIFWGAVFFYPLDSPSECPKDYLKDYPPPEKSRNETKE